MARRPAARAFGGVGKGLSPISSSTTSLPRAFSARAIASTVKAVSALRSRARALRRGMGASRFSSRRRSRRPRLLRRDHLGERPHDPREDPRLDDLLANLALAAERLDEAAIRARPPVLPDRE